MVLPRQIVSGIVGVLLSAGSVSAADVVPGLMDSARQAYQKGDWAKTARDLDAVLTELHNRLGAALTGTFPPPLSGWQADAVEVQGLGDAGGGLSLTRAYAKGDSSLNASLILDSPAVEGVQKILSDPSVPRGNTRLVKVGAEDALLRYDSSTKSGEVTMVVGGRAMLEVQGDELAHSDILLEAAKGWDLPAIRKQLGL